MPTEAQGGAAWTQDELATDPHAHAEKQRKVQQMFAAIAHAYDRNNRLHSFGRDQAWRKAAVKLAGLKPTDAVLDCACGTGDLSLAFAQAGAERVVGLDYTPEMLDVARARKAHPKIEYVQGDAQALGFEDDSFDVVSIAFGIRNVQVPAQALAEFRRVLRPGGRLVILEFSEPRFAPVRWGNDLYTKVIMPRTAALVAGDKSGAYAYLPKSVERFMTREEMQAAMEGAGFEGVMQKPMTFGVCVIYRGVVPGAAASDEAGP